MKKRIPIILNLDKVEHARLFLDNLHFGDKGPVTMVTTSLGRELYFKDMSDEEAIHFANELYNLQPESLWKG